MSPFRLPTLPSFCRTLLVCLVCGSSASSLLAQNSKRHTTPKPSPSASPTASPSPASTYVVPDVVATVDGEAIHKADLEHVASALLANRGRTLEGLGTEEKTKVYGSVWDDMITDRLVNRQAAGETVDPMDVEKRLAELRAQYPSPEAFDAEIKKSGQTTDQVRENLRLQIAQQQWIEHQIADQVTVGPDEALKFYKEGPSSKFDAPEMVRASHILVLARHDAPPEEVLAAEKKADDLYARIKKGESFEDLARANSEDPKSKTADHPGDLGYFSRERIMPEFADAAFKLKVGEVSPPVRTQFGFHIIKVTDRKPAHTATFDEAHEQIDAYLHDEKRRTAVAKLIESLKDKAKIETFLP